eukprot:TRINITY_DN5397_c0_g1_i1.p1 TRINITY_DN5397_c0_g1~~TRINITY_DN5397_c0_g1_i1.p1  ORF type:complete len:368 (+),score=83.35 TRINITY_DN5397_c0_g1_i1:31-1104(+)
MTCCVCLELFTDPVTLPCPASHTVCFGCLDKLVRRANSQVEYESLKGEEKKASETALNSIRCPLCDTPMAVDLAKVSHSTTIAAVVEGLRSELVYKKNMLCYKCERKNKTVPAEQFCQNCNAPFCGPCCSKAHANRYMATHTMSLISEGKKIALLEQCSVHGKPKDVYCKEDKQLCCLYCTALSGSIHKTHTVIAVCDAATECRAQLAAAQSEVAQAEETLSKVSPCVEKAVKDVARAMEAAQETMEAFCTQATTTLEATRQRVTVAIAKFASEKQAALAKQSAAQEAPSRLCVQQRGRNTARRVRGGEEVRRRARGEHRNRCEFGRSNPAGLHSISGERQCDIVACSSAHINTRIP